VELKKLLMKTFQHLMSSISVQDARMSVEQSQLSNQQSLRATQLTILASIYVPFIFRYWNIWDESERAKWVKSVDLGVFRRYSYRDDCDRCYLFGFAGTFEAQRKQD
jgi:hypothetical protein